MDFRLQFSDGVAEYALTFKSQAQTPKDVEVKVGEHTYFVSGEAAHLDFFNETIKPVIGTSHASVEELKGRLSAIGVRNVTIDAAQKTQVVAAAAGLVMREKTPEVSRNALQASMAAGDIPTFMQILIRIEKEEIEPIKSSVMTFLVDHRKEVCRYASVRPLMEDETVRCALMPLSGEGAPYYGLKMKDRWMFAENVVVYELKDGDSRVGYAVVARNLQKTQDLASYKRWLSQKAAPLYEVTFITTKSAHRGKGLAYVLLYRVLSDILSPGGERGARVTLLDQSEFAGTRLYQKVGSYSTKDGSMVEFTCQKNALNEYFYQSPR